jgi:broad specificity phosphatase PhoE
MSVSRSRTWYLVRHGETEWNAERRMQGQWDSRLSAAGKLHADASGRFLATLPIEVVYASPIGRVQETARIIRPHLDIEPILDDRLKEWSSGEWSGFLYDEIAQKWPEAFSAWRSDMLNVRAPGGENFHDLLARAESFLAEAAERPGDAIAILAHGFINRALACTLMGSDPSETLVLKQGNDTIFRITTEGEVADACHFIAGAGPHAGLPKDDTIVAA